MDFLVLKGVESDYDVTFKIRSEFLELMANFEIPLLHSVVILQFRASHSHFAIKSMNLTSSAI